MKKSINFLFRIIKRQNIKEKIKKKRKNWMIHLCMMHENIWQNATFESDGFTWNIIQCCWVNLPSQKMRMLCMKPLIPLACAEIQFAMTVLVAGNEILCCPLQGEPSIKVSLPFFLFCWWSSSCFLLVLLLFVRLFCDEWLKTFWMNSCATRINSQRWLFNVA